MHITPQLMQLAVNMARSYLAKLPRNVLAEDVIQAAKIGLWDGLRRHPDDYNIGYLKCRIRGEIQDELRRQSWQKRIHVGERAVVVRFDDISEEWEDLFSSPSVNPEAEAIAQIDRSKAWSADLSDVDRRIVFKRYVQGKQQNEIAKTERLSEARISQREKRALRLMREYLAAPAPREKRRYGVLPKEHGQARVDPSSKPVRPHPGGPVPIRVADPRVVHDAELHDQEAGGSGPSELHPSLALSCLVHGCRPAGGGGCLQVFGVLHPQVSKPPEDDAPVHGGHMGPCVRLARNR